MIQTRLELSDGSTAGVIDEIFPTCPRPGDTIVAGDGELVVRAGPIRWIRKRAKGEGAGVDYIVHIPVERVGEPEPEKQPRGRRPGPRVTETATK